MVVVLGCGYCDCCGVVLVVWCGLKVWYLVKLLKYDVFVNYWINCCKDVFGFFLVMGRVVMWCGSVYIVFVSVLVVVGMWLK